MRRAGEALRLFVLGFLGVRLVMGLEAEINPKNPSHMTTPLLSYRLQY